MCACRLARPVRCVWVYQHHFSGACGKCQSFPGGWCRKLRTHRAPPMPSRGLIHGARCCAPAHDRYAVEHIGPVTVGMMTYDSFYDCPGPPGAV
jgi:hypothetical protein